MDQPTTSPIQNEEVEQTTTSSPFHEEMDQIAVPSPQNEEEEEQNAPTTSTPNLITTCAPLQTLASGLALARIADFFAQEDERVLRCHGFKAVFIPCEKLETVLQRDRKDLKLKQMKEQREKRMAENEERKRKNRETYGNDSDSDRDEREKKSILY